MLLHGDIFKCQVALGAMVFVDGHMLHYKLVKYIDNAICLGCCKQ